MNYLGALALTLVAMLAMALVPALLGEAAAGRGGSGGPATPGQAGADPLLLGAGTVLAIGAALLPGLYLYADRGRWDEALALRTAPARTALLALLAGLALQIPLTEVQNLSEMIFPLSLEQRKLVRGLMNPGGVRQTLAVLFALVVVAPCCEDALFRGLILERLASRYGAERALVWSSLLFGIAHGRLAAAVLPAALAGLALGLVRLRTGSLLPAVLLHAAVNLLPILLPESLLRIEGFNTLGDTVSHVPLPVLLLTAGVAAAALCALLKASDRSAGTGSRGRLAS
jgi:membrane protease YdiL (CAAX protease family)